MVIIDSDPRRQWFLYFQEKEIGPLNESEVLEKLQSGEINDTAYVYTEGMPDWALISETPVLQGNPAPSIPSVSLSTVVPTANNVLRLESKTTSIESLGIASTKVDAPAMPSLSPKVEKKKKGPSLFARLFKKKQKTGEITTKKAVELEIPRLSALLEPQNKEPIKGQSKGLSKEANKGKRKNRVPVLVALLIVIGIAAFYSQKMSQPDAVPHTKASSKTTSSAKPTTQLSATAPGIEAAFPWDELTALRQSQDTKGPPFRLASRNFGGKRPVLVGAVSPLIKAEALQLAIFSDSDRSLFAVPKLWNLKVPVIDGYFSAGPLTDSGKELSPGLYHVMAAYKGNLLGEVTFELGPWPTAGEVTEVQSHLEQERVGLAQKEKAALEAKLSEITAATTELKNIGKFTMAPSKPALRWKQISEAWAARSANALNDQRNVLSGPMFFPEMQAKIYNFMLELQKIFEAVDLDVKSGPRAVQSKYGKGLGQLWVALDQKESALVGEIQTLANPTPSNIAPLKIEAAIIKKSLTSLE